MPASHDISVIWAKRCWTVKASDGEVRFAYRAPAIAKARMFRDAARGRGEDPRIVIQERDGVSRPLLR